MIRAIQNDRISVACVRARQPQSKIIRFASGANKKTDAQRIGKRVAKPFRILDKIRVEITRIRIQLIHLFPCCLNHIRVRVPYMTNVVHTIEIGPSIFVIQVLLLTSNDVQRSFIGDAESAAEMLFSITQNLDRRARIPFSAIQIRTQTKPDISFTRSA